VSEAALKKETPKLGRGLEALIPKNYFASGKTVINIPVSEIVPNPYQPRGHFDQEALDHLSKSIKNHGLAQPVLVRRVKNGYELIAGERRFRACQMAGMDKVPAIVREMTDRDSLKIALIENLDREDLNPIEEAKGYQRLLEEFEINHQELGDMFNKSRSAVTNTLRLLRLPQQIQDALEAGEISEGHARSLLAFDDENQMLHQLQQIKSEGLNVRELEQVVADHKQQKSKEAGTQLALFQDLETVLSNRYEARFKIKGNSNKGKIEIRYTSPNQFEQICQALNIS